MSLPCQATTYPGTYDGLCPNTATWRLSWVHDEHRSRRAMACGKHIAALAPRDKVGLMLEPLDPAPRS